MLPRLLVILAAALMVAAPANAAAPIGNLVANPGAQEGTGITDPAQPPVLPPQWQGATLSNGPTEAVYGSFGSMFPGTAVSALIDGETQLFLGGPVEQNQDTRTIIETLDLTPYAADVDRGHMHVTFSADLGGSGSDPDETTALVRMGQGYPPNLLELTLGPVTAADRNDTTTLLPRSADGAVPVGSRQVQVFLTFTRKSGSGTYNDASADNVSLTFTDETPPDVHTVDATSVVPNAAQVNGTINDYGTPVTYRVQYGQTDAYGSVSADATSNGVTADDPVHVNLAGLKPGTDYHARLVADSPEGEIDGEDITFHTPSTPETTIVSGPGDPTNDSTPTFTFSSDTPEATFECSVDGAAFTTCTTPYTTSPLDDGTHTFAVRAVLDDGVDPTPASRTFTVDTVAPDTTITAGPADGSVLAPGAAAPSYSFVSSEPGSTFTCLTSGGAPVSCTSPAAATPSGPGTWTFSVAATDAAGNTDPTPATRTFTLPRPAPDTIIDSGPAGPTNDNTPTFTFHSDQNDATFECKTDDGAFAPCTSPDTLPTLPDGEHTITVRAVSPIGLADPTPAARTFTVDTVPPETTIVSGPADGAGIDPSDPAPVYGFQSSEPASTFGCATSKGAAGALSTCATPAAAKPTGTGLWTFSVAATDAAGNTDPTPATRTFDNAGVDTLILTGPSGAIWNTRPTYSFIATVGGSTFGCRVDNGAWSSCSSATTLATQASGPHTFYVRATSPKGVVDKTPASRSFTVQATKSDSRTCTTHISLGANPLVYACYTYLSPANGCWAYSATCPRTTDVCPSGAKCTLTQKVVGFSNDTNIELNYSTEVGWGTFAKIENGASTTCKAYGHDSCASQASTSIIGTGQPPLSGCGNFSWGSGPGTIYDDAARTLTCTATLKIQPYAPFVPVLVGHIGDVYVPGNGLLVISALLGGGGRNAEIAATPKIATFRRSVKQAGPVSFELKLNRAAKRRLRHRQHLPVTLKTTFTPAGGGHASTATTTTRITRSESPSKCFARTKCPSRKNGV